MCEKCEETDSLIYETKGHLAHREWGMTMDQLAEKRMNAMNLGPQQEVQTGYAGSRVIGAGQKGPTRPRDAEELTVLLQMGQSIRLVNSRQSELRARFEAAGMVDSNGHVNQEAFYLYLDALLQVPYPVKTWRMP